MTFFLILGIALNLQYSDGEEYLQHIDLLDLNIK